MLLWYGKDRGPKYREAAARKLLGAVIFFETQHRLRVNKSNPVPYLDSSRPGEYMRARTGWGRDHLMHQPASVADIVAAGLKVRVGFAQNAFYMLILEVYRGRLGLQQTLRDIRPQIAAWIKGVKGP